MKHPTSRNRVQRQAELYSKRYSIDVTVAENNSSSSGEEVLLKNRNVGVDYSHNAEEMKANTLATTSSDESSSDDEERFRSRAELYRMNQRAQLVRLMASFHRQQQRFASQYQQHVYSVDRDKILSKLAALSPFFYFTAAQFTSMCNLLGFLLADAFKESDHISGSEVLRLGELLGMYLAPHLLLACRAALQDRLAALCAGGGRPRSGLGAAAAGRFWTQLAADQLSGDLLMWAALSARLGAHPALRSNALQDAAVQDVVDRVGCLFSAMEAAQVRLLIALLRAQEVCRTMLACGLPVETVRALRSLVVAEVGLPPLFADLLPAQLFPDKAFLLSLLDATARVGLLSKPKAGGRSTYHSSSSSSIFVGYSVTVREGHPDLQLGLAGVPRLGLCLYPGYSAVLELLFALHANLLLLLDDRLRQRQGLGREGRPTLTTEKAGLSPPVSRLLCICGLPIGDWSFVGTAGTGSTKAGYGPPPPCHRRYFGISDSEVQVRASIAQCICERCYRSIIACSQPPSGPALAASHSSALYCTGKCSMVVSEALRRPTFEQVFALRDRLAGFVDHHQGGGGPDLDPDLDMDMDMDAVDRHLLRMQTLTSPQRTNWLVPDTNTGGGGDAEGSGAGEGPSTTGRGSSREAFSRRYLLRELQAVNSHCSLRLHFPLQRRANTGGNAGGIGQGSATVEDAGSPRHLSLPLAVPVPVPAAAQDGQAVAILPSPAPSSSGPGPGGDGDDSFALYRHVLAHPHPHSQGAGKGRRSLKNSVRFALPSQSADDDDDDPPDAGTAAAAAAAAAPSARSFSAEQSSSGNLTHRPLGEQEQDPEGQGQAAPTIDGYPFESPPPSRSRKFSLGSMMSQNKIREFSRKIFHGLGYPTATSGYGTGQGPGPGQQGQYPRLGPHHDPHLVGPERAGKGGGGGGGEEANVEDRQVRVPASPKRLRSPEDRVRSAQARDFFDLQQFILDLWTGITVKIIAGQSDKEKVRVLYIRSSISQENEYIAAQVRKFKNMSGRHATGSPTTSSSSSSMKHYDKEEPSNRLLASNVNPLSPQREVAATCSLRDALDRRRTSRLFLCWARPPPTNRDRDRDRDGVTGRGDRRGQEEKEKKTKQKEQQMQMQMQGQGHDGHDDDDGGRRLLRSFPFKQDKSADLDRCLVRPGGGQWAQCVLLTSSSSSSSSSPPGQGSGGAGWVPPPPPPLLLLAWKLEDSQQQRRAVQGLEEILLLRRRA